MSTSMSARQGSPLRSRRRRALAALGVAVLALVGAACEQMHPDNRAASIPMVTNGNLPITHLRSTTKGCVVYDEALASLNAMVLQAAKDGVTLRPSSCYRDYAGQVAARESWCNRGACQMAAVPGTSNHGWGKAIDFADQTGSLTWDSPGYTWLKTWGWHFGWMHPTVMEPGGSVPEPWHFEWIGDGGKMFLGQYFGIGNAPPAVPRGQPIGSLDIVAARPGEVNVTGWAIDPDVVGSIPVHVYVDASGVAFTADQPRSDVAAAFPLYASQPHGFSGVVSATPGRHQVCAYAINVAGTGGNAVLGCAAVDVPALPPAAPASSLASSSSPTTPTPPTSTGWPGPGSTGATSASRPSGSITVTQAGTVIDGYDVTGTITVAADNVTIRNTRIRTGGPYGIAPTESTSGLVVEDVTIVGTGWGCSAGIGPNGSWTLRRSDISGCVDGIKVRANQLVEWNWVHDLRMGYQPNGSWAHNDALQSTSGSNVTIRGNNFEVDWAGGANGAIMMSSNFGSLQNYTLDGNRFAGGQYVVSIRDQGHGDPRNIVVTNNTWVRGDWHYGPTNFSGTSVKLGAGNRYDDGSAM